MGPEEGETVERFCPGVPNPGVSFVLPTMRMARLVLLESYEGR